jgi:nucleoside-diphosphate-sugar epimerase
MGDRTTNKPFDVSTRPAPVDLYGRSKLMAEHAALKIPGLAVSIIRPPAIYGPGMTGSLLTMFRLADRRYPLPFGSLNNARDFLALPSLVDLLCACLEKPSAVNRILLARDGRALSSGGWYREIAAALGKDARLMPCPSQALKLALWISGRSDLAESLLHSLEIDDRRTRGQLGWSPVCSVQDSLRLTAKWFVESDTRVLQKNIKFT